MAQKCPYCGSKMKRVRKSGDPRKHYQCTRDTKHWLVIW